MFKPFSYTDALHLYLDTRYGRDGWVRGLSPNQRATLRLHPPGSPEPSDPQARAEWDRATHLDRLARLQREDAAFWLRSSGFPSELWFEGFDPEALKKKIEDALARDFGAGAPPDALPQPAVLKLGVGPPVASSPTRAENEEIVEPSIEVPADITPPGSTVADPPQKLSAAQVADEPTAPRSPAGVDIASSPVQQATDPAEASGKKQVFIEWEEAEKAAHGSYPPLQASYNERDNVRTWATRNRVTRSIAEGWARELGFARSRGRPSSKLGSRR